MNGRAAATGGGDLGHPGSDTLAAYADRTLSAGERSAVERHVADCETCREVLTDTLDFLRESLEPVRFQAKPRRRWTTPAVVAGLAVAAALVVAVRLAPPRWLAAWFGAEGRRAEFEQLVAAVGNVPTRPVEGRLTGGFRYAPPPAVTRGGSEADISPDVRIAAGGIESAARDDRSPASLRDLGVARLVLRDYDGAIAALEAATAADSSSAESYSDLAAAYLARGRADGSGNDLQRARDAAGRALMLTPDLPAALFNRALSLEALGQAGADAAWREVIAREGNTEWAREAQSRTAPP